LSSADIVQNLNLNDDSSKSHPLPCKGWVGYDDLISYQADICRRDQIACSSSSSAQIQLNILSLLKRLRDIDNSPNMRLLHDD
jgi:hypothetical protein